MPSMRRPRFGRLRSPTRLRFLLRPWAGGLPAQEPPGCCRARDHPRLRALLSRPQRERARLPGWDRGAPVLWLRPRSHNDRRGRWRADGARGRGAVGLQHCGRVPDRQAHGSYRRVRRVPAGLAFFFVVRAGAALRLAAGLAAAFFLARGTTFFTRRVISRAPRFAVLVAVAAARSVSFTRSRLKLRLSRMREATASFNLSIRSPDPDAFRAIRHSSIGRGRGTPAPC